MNLIIIVTTVKLVKNIIEIYSYHQKSKIIIYAWVNDDNTKRAYGSSTDAYRVFRRMIESGHPPDDWKTLLEEARQESKRLQDTLKKSG